MSDQRLTKIAGSTINSMTKPRMVATRRKASAGLTMPSMSQKAVADPAAFERANYMKALQSYKAN